MKRNPIKSAERSRRYEKKKLLPNGNLQVSIPIKFRAIGSRHKIVFPGEVNEAPVIVAVARAFRWQRYIDEGKFSNINQLAKAVGLDSSFVAANLRLRWLAPKVVHELIQGGIGNVSLKQLRHGVPVLWSDQEKALMGE